jgi:hypothetical protein
MMLEDDMGMPAGAPAPTEGDESTDTNEQASHTGESTDEQV